jgi:hypothetical protein
LFQLRQGFDGSRFAGIERHAIQLGLHVLQLGGRGREEGKGPGQRTRRRLMARQQERDHMVAQVLVAERRALLCARLQEQTQEVHRRRPRPGPRAAVVVDDVRHDAVDRRQRAAEGQVAREGQPERQVGDPTRAAKEFVEQHRKRRLHLTDATLDLRPEQAAPGDRKRQPAHLGHEVEGGPGRRRPLPTHTGLVDDLQHGPTEVHQVAVMKNGLHGLTLLSPGRAFRGQQALPSHHPDAAGTAGVAQVVGGADLQHFGDQGGIRHQVIGQRPEFQSGHRPTGLRRREKKPQRIALERPGMAQNGGAGWTGRAPDWKRVAAVVGGGGLAFHRG